MDKKLIVPSESLRKLIPASQLRVTMESIKSYQNVIADLNEKVEHIPALYETDEMKRHPCVLHYFFLGCDWYIAEWDREQNLFFGYAILNNDLYNSEWGYISLDELLRIPMINLDYHFTPYTVEDALYRKNKAYFAEYAVEDKR